MVYVRNPKIIDAGDRVRLTQDYEYTSRGYLLGTFTEGHEFTVEEVSGLLKDAVYILIDDDKRCIINVEDRYLEKIENP